MAEGGRERGEGEERREKGEGENKGRDEVGERREGRGEREVTLDTK